MCYNVKTLVQSQLKRAIHQGNQQAVEEIKHNLDEMGVKDDIKIFSAGLLPSNMEHWKKSSVGSIPASTHKG